MNFIVDHKKAMYNGAIIEPEQRAYNAMPEPSSKDKWKFVFKYAKSQGQEIIDEELHGGDICYYSDDKRMKETPMKVEIISFVNYKGDVDGVNWKEVNSSHNRSGWHKNKNHNLYHI